MEKLSMKNENISAFYDMNIKAYTRPLLKLQIVL